MGETAKAGSAALCCPIPEGRGAPGRAAPSAGAILDALPAQVAALDRGGIVVAANAAWRRAAAGAETGLPILGIGADYIAAWAQAARGDEGAAAAARGLAAVAQGHSEGLTFEWPWRCQGEERWAQIEASPLPDGQGCVVTCHDITARKRTEARFRASEGRFRSLVENMPGIIFCRGVKGGSAYGYDPGGAQLYGRDAPRLAGTADERGRARIDIWYEAIHPEDRAAYLAAERRRKEAFEPYEIEYRITHPLTGEPRWMREVAWVVEDAHLGQTFFDSYILDITERKRAEAALKESDLRLRRIIESDAVGMVVLDAAGRLREANDTFLELVGRTRAELERGALDLLALTPPEHRQLTVALVAEAARGKRQRPFETELLRPQGERVGVLLGAACLGGEEGLCVCLVTDLSDRRVADRRRLLLQELNHRVKNTLAMVQAIAQQTGRGADTVGGFLTAFCGRLAALSAAHDLLVAHGWQGVRIEDLLGRALKAHLADARRLTLTLPPLVLRPQAAQDLALAVHELATNATKHGALSVPGGHVALTGQVEGGELVLVWREEGGPPTRPPNRQGFGTTLLTQAIRHQHRGRVVFDWRGEGLVCTMALPLATAAELAAQPPAAPRPA